MTSHNSTTKYWVACRTLYAVCNPWFTPFFRCLPYHSCACCCSQCGRLWCRHAGPVPGRRGPQLTDVAQSAWLSPSGREICVVTPVSVHIRRQSARPRPMSTRTAPRSARRLRRSLRRRIPDRVSPALKRKWPVKATPSRANFAESLSVVVPVSGGTDEEMSQAEDRQLSDDRHRAPLATHGRSLLIAELGAPPDPLTGPTLVRESATPDQTHVVIPTTFRRAGLNMFTVLTEYVSNWAHTYNAFRLVSLSRAPGRVLIYEYRFSVPGTMFTCPVYLSTCLPPTMLPELQSEQKLIKRAEILFLQ